MAEREAREPNPPGDESLLTREFVQLILSRAKENLRKDGALQPMLFVHFKCGDTGILPLRLPATTEEKEAYFEEVGLAMLKGGKRIDEAVFLSETWYVMAEQDEKLTLDVAPSRHPKRKEAITIVGRDSKRTRATIVMQPFSRDRHNQPVFEHLAVEEYDLPPQGAMQPVGLLDYLFPKRAGFLN